MESVSMENEYNFLCDIENALGEYFQLLGSYKNYQKYLSILKGYEDLSLSLIFLGDTSSGKTTLINAIVAYLILEDQKEINTQDELAKIRQSYENFQFFLQPALNENTFSTTIIKPSNDDHYHLKFGETNDEIVDLNKIKGYFEDLNKDAVKIVQYMHKNNKSQDSLDATPEEIEKEKEYDEKINRITVVQIPNIKRKINLYDIPGISGELPQKLAEKLLLDGCFIPLICLTKDLTSFQANTEGIVKIMKIFRDQFYGQIYLSIIFTKSDLLYKNGLKGSKYFSEPTLDDMEGELIDNSPALSANFIEFESQMESVDFKIVDYQLINPISILISEKSYSRLKDLQDLNIKKLSALINSIESFFVKYVPTLFENRIKTQIKAAINQDFGAKTILTDDNITEIKKSKESSVQKFSAEITEYVRNFPKNSEKLKEIYPDMYYGLMTSIIETESKVDFYVVKSNYIKNMIQSIQPVFNTAIGKDISNKMTKWILELWKSYSSEIREKLEKLLSSNEEQKLGGASLVQRLVSFAFSFIGAGVVRYGVAAITGEMIAVGFGLIIPGIGLILAGITLFFISSDYIGVWTKSGAREDIINNMLQAFTVNSAKIIDAYEKSFNDILTKITGGFISKKDKTIIQEQLYDAIDSVKTRENIFEPQKISKTLVDKIKDDKSLKPGVIDFFKDLSK